MKTMQWYVQSVTNVVAILKTNLEQGLTQDEVQTRLKEYGPNRLPEPPQEPLWHRLAQQFTNVLVLVLIAATVVSFAFGEYVDAVVILVIVLVNGFLGFYQEYKAEQSLEALKKLSAQYAMVLRDGERQKISVEELVPGDIIILNAGDKVPADARLVENFNVSTQEAILTGESLPVPKSVDPLQEKHYALGDQVNMLFKDTIVSSGHGQAVVVATGGNTEVGKISQLLSEQEEGQTPLQVELDKVGKRLSLAAGVIILVVFVVGVLIHTTTVLEMFLTAVALAVAAIPEGLPAVVTIVLSLGVTRMARHRAIVKRLPAVETLGATSIICSDKTGTLTQNRIRVANIATREQAGTVSDFKQQAEQSEAIRLLFTNSIVNSDASVRKQDNGEIEEVGDQTEVALLLAAQELGFDIDSIRDGYPLLYQVPFDSDKKYMVTVHDHENEVVIFVKGAPEVVLHLANSITSEDKLYWEGQIQSMAREGLRTLGFAYRQLSRDQWEEIKNQEQKMVEKLSFIGMVGEQDPIRPEVVKALKLAKKAGIHTVMVTGDHKLTALSIAKQLSMAKDESQVLTGEELSDLTDEQLVNRLEAITVYARVNPEQKLRLVKLYQSHLRAKVAVTGDGVNDAPAIKAGDIGVAMGIEGTDVTREVADLVLEDDNYATIVYAVREGRVIFANLVKFIRYLISCNISEIFVVFFAIVLGYPTPLLPIQLLWINLVTDGLPALALGMDPPEKDVMHLPPRDTKEGILTPRRWLHMSIEGLVIGIATLIGFIYLDNGYGDDVARTAAFTTLAFSQLIHALNNRSEHLSLFTLGLSTNHLLIGTIIVSALLQLTVIYTGLGNLLFKAVALPPAVLGGTIVLAFIPLVFVEGWKLVGRNKNS